LLNELSFFFIRTYLSFADIKRYRFMDFQIPSTIEDPMVFHEIKEVLQKLGYAKFAPDPQ